MLVSVRIDNFYSTSVRIKFVVIDFSEYLEIREEKRAENNLTL